MGGITNNEVNFLELNIEFYVNLICLKVMDQKKIKNDVTSSINTSDFLD